MRRLLGSLPVGLLRNIIALLESGVELIVRRAVAKSFSLAIVSVLESVDFHGGLHLILHGVLVDVFARARLE